MRENKNARGIIISNGKAALIYRKKGRDKYYTTPGGGVEAGETLEEALSREVMEETGLEVTKAELVLEEDWKGMPVYYFKCEIKEEKDLVMNGPEKYPENGQIYKPEWIDLKDMEKIEMVRPDSIREYLKTGKV